MSMIMSSVVVCFSIRTRNVIRSLSYKDSRYDKTSAFTSKARRIILRLKWEVF